MTHLDTYKAMRDTCHQAYASWLDAVQAISDSDDATWNERGNTQWLQLEIARLEYHSVRGELYRYLYNQML